MGIEPVTTRCLVAVLTTKLLGQWVLAGTFQRHGAGGFILLFDIIHHHHASLVRRTPLGSRKRKSRTRTGVRVAWANGHSEQTCRAAWQGGCSFVCAAGREVAGRFPHWRCGRACGEGSYYGGRSWRVLRTWCVVCLGVILVCRTLGHTPLVPPNQEGRCARHVREEEKALPATCHICRRAAHRYEVVCSMDAEVRQRKSDGTFSSEASVTPAPNVIECRLLLTYDAVLNVCSMMGLVPISDFVARGMRQLLRVDSRKLGHF